MPELLACEFRAVLSDNLGEAKLTLQNHVWHLVRKSRERAETRLLGFAWHIVEIYHVRTALQLCVWCGIQ